MHSLVGRCSTIPVSELYDNSSLDSLLDTNHFLPPLVGPSGAASGIQPVPPGPIVACQPPNQVTNRNRTEVSLN